MIQRTFRHGKGTAATSASSAATVASASVVGAGDEPSTATAEAGTAADESSTAGFACHAGMRRLGIVLGMWPCWPPSGTLLAARRRFTTELR